jgi:hypothetical protein
MFQVHLTTKNPRNVIAYRFSLRAPKTVVDEGTGQVHAERTDIRQRAYSWQRNLTVWLYLGADLPATKIKSLCTT